MENYVAQRPAIQTFGHSEIIPTNYYYNPNNNVPQHNNDMQPTANYYYANNNVIQHRNGIPNNYNGNYYSQNHSYNNYGCNNNTNFYGHNNYANYGQNTNPNYNYGHSTSANYYYNPNTSANYYNGNNPSAANYYGHNTSANCYGHDTNVNYYNQINTASFYGQNSANTPTKDNVTVSSNELPLQSQLSPQQNVIVMQSYDETCSNRGDINSTAECFGSRTNRFSEANTTVLKSVLSTNKSMGETRNNLFEKSGDDGQNSSADAIANSSTDATSKNEQTARFSADVNENMELQETSHCRLVNYLRELPTTYNEAAWRNDAIQEISHNLNYSNRDSTRDSTLQLASNGDNDVYQPACDNSQMFVATSNEKKKKLCCLYCHKTYVALARHLATVHKDKEDVQKFLYLEKGSTERSKIIDILRKRGTFIWNSNAKLNKGQLLTSRRPNPKWKKKNATDYQTCANCLGTFTKTNLRNHTAKQCKQIRVIGRRSIKVLGRAVEGRIHAKASKRLRLVVFPKLREDHIVRLVRYDWLLIEYGNHLCLKYIPHYQHNLIRNHLRQLGTLLFILKGINPDVTDFESMYHPRFYDSMVDAIRILGKFDFDTNDYGSPNTATTTPTYVKDVADILISQYIRRGESENQKHTENFVKLMNTGIPVSINKVARDTQLKRRREKVENIPSTDDIKTFASYLEREAKTSYEELEENYSYQLYCQLSELVAASIVVFNRRRTGEVGNILLTEFINRDSINEDTHTQLFASLSDRSKEIARKYSRMKIRGKRTRTVNVLLNPFIAQCIQLLIDNRENARIADHNIYLFALTTSGEHEIKVTDVCGTITKLSDLCGAKNPTSLRGTNLRKHIATICIDLDLNDNAIAQIADFLGHHEKIHREYYRQNPIQNEIVQMSQLLEKAQGKNVNIVFGDENDKSFQENESGDEVAIEERENSNIDLGLSIGPTSTNTNHPESEDEYVPTTQRTKVSLKFRKRKNAILTSSDESRDEQENVPKPKYLKTRYSAEELDAVKEAFATHLQNKTLPSTNEIRKQQKARKALRNRTWQQRKTWISNQNKKAN